jgi:predicted nucleic-acid-binding protein
MITIDTNVLVRICVDDESEPAQVRQARELASQAQCLYVPQVVQVESVWVMTKAYKLEKAEILKVLANLHTNPALVLEKPDIFQAAFLLYGLSNVGFSDCIILAEARKAGLALHTFDKRLEKLANSSVTRWGDI